MKIIYELDDEKDSQDSVEIMHNATNYYCALVQIGREIRQSLDNNSETIDKKALEEIKDILIENKIDF